MPKKNAYMVRIRGKFPYHKQVVETREEKVVVIVGEGEIEKAISKAREHYKDSQILHILGVDDLGFAITE